jgi:hypothetical protein
LGLFEIFVLANQKYKSHIIGLNMMKNYFTKIGLFYKNWIILQKFYYFTKIGLFYKKWIILQKNKLFYKNFKNKIS